MKEYKYYMNERPLSPGAQPRGFSRFDENDHGGRWGAIYYPRELTAQEISRHDHIARNYRIGTSNTSTCRHRGTGQPYHHRIEVILSFN